MRLQDHTGIISLRTFYLHLPVFAREKSKKAPVQVYKMISLSRLLLSFQTKKMVIYQKPFCRMRHFDGKNGPPPALFSSHSPWHLFRPDRGVFPLSGKERPAAAGREIFSRLGAFLRFLLFTAGQNCGKVSGYAACAAIPPGPGFGVQRRDRFHRPVTQPEAHII